MKKGERKKRKLEIGEVRGEEEEEERGDRKGGSRGKGR
jgi:hypothetical protein